MPAFPSHLLANLLSCVPLTGIRAYKSGSTSLPDPVFAPLIIAQPRSSSTKNTMAPVLSAAEPPPEPPKSLRSFQNLSLVYLAVGSTPRLYAVHEPLLLRAAGFFHTVPSTQHSKLEGLPVRRVDLPEDDPVLVDHFIRWLYFRSVGISSPVGHDLSYCFDTADRLLDLYIFAEKMSCPGLLDYLITCFQRLLRANWVPTWDFLLAVLDRTSQTGVLLHLLVDWFIWYHKAVWFRSDSTRCLMLGSPGLTVVFVERLTKHLRIHLPASSKKLLFNPPDAQRGAYRHPRAPDIDEDEASI